MIRIKELRKKQDKTQQEIADILNVDRTTYAKWETDTHKPDVDMLLKIAKLFSVSTDYLLEETNIPNPTNTNEEEKLLVYEEAFSLDVYAKEKNMSVLDLALIKSYLDMPYEMRNTFLNHIRTNFSNANDETSTAATDLE